MLSVRSRGVGLSCCRLTMLLLSKSYASVRPLLQCKDANPAADIQPSIYFLRNYRYGIQCARVKNTYVFPDIWRRVVASARFSSLSQETFEQASRSHPAPDGSHDGSVNDDIRKARRVNFHICRRYRHCVRYLLRQNTRASCKIVTQDRAAKLQKNPVKLEINVKVISALQGERN